eukprot:COSAG02_NODE_3502_length_6644_cov_4.775095_2_plen_67_part_00
MADSGGLLAFHLTWGHLKEAAQLLINKLKQVDDGAVAENSHILEVFFRDDVLDTASLGAPLGMRFE